MRQFRTLLAGALALGLVSCSSEEDFSGGTTIPSEGQNVYASLTLNLPTARSQRANAGDEYGQDYENRVGSVLVVLAQKKTDGTYTYVTSSLSDGVPGTGSTTGSLTTPNPTYTIVFNNAELLAKAGENVSVFAYANPTQALRDGLAGFENQVADFNPSIWSDNSFLMSSVGEIQEITLPSAEELAANHDTPEKAFKLMKQNDNGTYQPVPVERVMARMDYKSGAVDNIYPIQGKVVDKDGNMTEETVANIELTDMALFNMATQYYFLPRTSVDGQNTAYTLCPGRDGMEQNYVVGPKASEFSSYLSTGSNQLTGYFETPLVEAEGATFTPIKSITAEDNDEGWTGQPDNTGYHIWRYVVENPIPKAQPTAGSAERPAADAQRKGITTGVLFKGKINIVEGSTLAKNVKDNEPIYMYNDVIYGGIDALAKAAELAPVSSLADDFKLAFEQNESGEWVEKTGDDVPSKHNFTVYRYDAEAGCYPVYYYYYNRHNNNGNNSVMDEMEFGVVRNNVYKLSVTNITRFGHPTRDDDPDPEDPDDPDEEQKVYFEVSCEVLPWVVRVNNIEL